MTPQRIAEYERLLRRLRARAFSDDPRIAPLIERIKARLMPIWDARAAEAARKRIIDWWRCQ